MASGRALTTAVLERVAAASAWRSWRTWLLCALAVQYAAFQLATGVQYWDGPRNLHWGLLVLDEPRFLLDAEDPLNRVNGFPPEDARLAPRGLASDSSSPLHPWWGPLYPLIFGGVWWLTGSYALLQLVVPAAACATVLLTYAFGARYLGRDAGLLGAALLALFPVFREHAVLAFGEPISALLLLGALLAFVARRTWPAALLGALAMYGKIDLIALYLGTAGLTWLLSRGDGRLPARHVAISLGVPLISLLPWVVLVYGVIGRPTTVGGGPSWSIFVTLGPQMLEQLFMLPWALTLGVLAGLAAAVGAGLLQLRRSQPVVCRLLGVWLALGLVVVLTYAAMPGASNNPRVFIPALPACCLLAAAGLMRLGRRARVYAAGALLVLFVLLNASGMLFQVLQARLYAEAAPAWEVLRREPRGVVLTDMYWHAALFTRQPVTWFEHDPAFERAIMHDAANFRRYLAVAPIRYVVLPRDPQLHVRQLETPLARLYRSLPIGRDLGWRTEPLAAPEVRAYLEETFPSREAGAYVIFYVG